MQRFSFKNGSSFGFLAMSQIPASQLIPSAKIGYIRKSVRRSRLGIIDLQRDDLTLASPENQAGLQAIRVDSLFVGQHLFVARYLRCRLEVQGSASARAPSYDTQLFQWAKPISCDVNQRVIEKPTDDLHFVGFNSSVHPCLEFTPRSNACFLSNSSIATRIALSNFSA